MTDYTRKERDAINAAWRSLEYLASCRNTRDGWELEQALKHERRERSCLTVAKALMLRTWADGFREPATPAHVLYGFSRGCRLALLMGADTAEQVRRERERYGDERSASGWAPLHVSHDFPALLAKIDAADALHEASIQRRLAAL